MKLWLALALGLKLEVPGAPPPSPRGQPAPQLQAPQLQAPQLQAPQVANAQPPVPVVRTGLTVPGVKLAGATPQLHFGAASDYVLGSDGAGALVIASPQGELVSVREGQMHVGVPVSAGLLDVSGLRIAGVDQWAMAVSDDFSEPVVGWSHTSTSSCAGLTMLGGYCNFAQGEVTRAVDGLAPHKQLRVQATYHFIDRWVGETAFMKMNVGVDGAMVPVWTDSHSQDNEKRGINVCGAEAVHEGKFAVRVDVSVPHSAPSVQIAFGSTMDAQDPCDESWGISNFEVYVK